MNKELEALERLRNTLLAESYWQDVLQDVALIETALKDYERLKQCIDERGNLINECIEVVAEKKLKALESIKEKEVNVFIFLHSGDLETYNDMVEDNRKLTQAEYELLKEILNNAN